MEKLKSLLKELMQKMEIKENVRLKIVPMKYKIASFSFHTNTLRLNKRIISILNTEEVKYILTHELVHAKIKSLYHGRLFQKELEKYYNIEEIQKLEKQIIEKLYEKICSISFPKEISYKIF